MQNLDLMDNNALMELYLTQRRHPVLFSEKWGIRRNEGKDLANWCANTVASRSCEAEMTRESRGRALEYRLIAEGIYASLPPEVKWRVGQTVQKEEE